MSHQAIPVCSEGAPTDYDLDSADEDYDAAEPPEAGEVAADAEMAEAEAGSLS